jgi:hypothetical protein
MKAADGGKSKFAVAGEDKKFVWAEPIQGAHILVSAHMFKTGRRALCLGG